MVECGMWLAKGSLKYQTFALLGTEVISKREATEFNCLQDSSRSHSEEYSRNWRSQSKPKTYQECWPTYSFIVELWVLQAVSRECDGVSPGDIWSGELEVNAWRPTRLLLWCLGL